MKDERLKYLNKFLTHRLIRWQTGSPERKFRIKLIFCHNLSIEILEGKENEDIVMILREDDPLGNDEKDQSIN